MTDAPLVTIVVPVWQDEDGLARALGGLRAENGLVEVVVVPVLGEEARYEKIREQFPALRWISAPRGRGAQMNAGAALGRGRWLLFLHADSALPAPWLNAIREADAHPDIVAGAFTLALDSRDWRARGIEAGVRLRVALFGMPYGDQALFVRRAVFERIGGYRDVPLMEDVDLVRRVRRVGRLWHSRLVVVTSARRWEQDGWMRRSAQNIALAASFLLGASPAGLAQRYLRRNASAVVMMGRAPWTGGKTRLAGEGDSARQADLRHALFLDTLDVVTSVSGVEHIIACEPASASETMRRRVGQGIDIIAQRGADLGERMANVFEDVFRLGVESVVVIGSDLPDLPADLLREALAALRGRKHSVVLGPARDGGYYLVGMNTPRPELFAGIEWSTDRVMAQTFARLQALKASVVVLPEWRDVDTAVNLREVMEQAPENVATRTRAWTTANPT